MAFNFIERPEKREFRYKPRFYNPDKESSGGKSGEEEYDSSKFAERLHRKWSSKRMTEQDRNKFPLKTVIFLMLIVFVLAFFFIKFLDK